MKSKTWVQSKLDAVATAWQWLYGAKPTPHACALALAPAWHETVAGDAWPGKNWGATTLRALTAQEESILVHAGIHPTVGPAHDQVAAQAMAALRAAGIPLPHGEIHCDSRTVKGPDGKAQIEPYFVWFASFDDDASGAAYYLGILAGVAAPKGARSVLLDPAGTVRELAALMYRQGYFWGFHPHDGGAGDAANVDDYAKDLEALWPEITAALDGWVVPDAAPRPVRNLLLGDTGEDVRRVQSWLQITQDGAFGPKMLHAVDVFRVARGLGAIGVWDDDCRKAMLGEPQQDNVMARLRKVQLGDWRPGVDAERANDSLDEDLAG